MMTDPKFLRAAGLTKTHLGEPSALVLRARSRSRSRRGQRYGYVYLAVLFTTLVVSAAVAASLAVSTGNLKSQVGRLNRQGALRLAESELHRQTARLSGLNDWRGNHATGIYSNWQSLTGISAVDMDPSAVRYAIAETDGDLSDSLYDNVQLTAHARVGNSHAAVSVELQPAYRGYSVLGYGVTASGNVTFGSNHSLVSDAKMQVGGSCFAVTGGAIVTPRLECDNAVVPVLRGELGADNVGFPVATAISAYEDTGTEIIVSSLSLQSGKRVIDSVVLTASQNPFGTADPNGVYWMDATGSAVQISNSRLGCTLAIRNALSVEISGAIVWEYASSPEAILVTDAPITFRTIEPVLDETTLSVNFNPATSPFRGSDSDADMSDQYNTDLRGLIYTESDLIVEATSDGSELGITGALIASQITLFNGVRVHRLPELVESPPLGFIDPTPMRFVQGTYRRVPTP